MRGQTIAESMQLHGGNIIGQVPSASSVASRAPQVGRDRGEELGAGKQRHKIKTANKLRPRVSLGGGKAGTGNKCILSEALQAARCALRGLWPAAASQP